MELIWIGATKPESIKMAMDMFVGRILKFTDLKITQIKSVKGIEDGVKLSNEEEKMILKSLGNKKRYVVLLDENGKSFSSRDFATWLDKTRAHIRPDITFIFGGAFGFSETFKNNADFILSFSPMTFSHQLIRLVFLEQLYRAFTIINNQPYHND